MGLLGDQAHFGSTPPPLPTTHAWAWAWWWAGRHRRDAPPFPNPSSLLFFPLLFSLISLPFSLLLLPALPACPSYIHTPGEMPQGHLTRSVKSELHAWKDSLACLRHAWLWSSGLDHKKHFALFAFSLERARPDSRQAWLRISGNMGTCSSLGQRTLSGPTLLYYYYFGWRAEWRAGKERFCHCKNKKSFLRARSGESGRKTAHALAACALCALPLPFTFYTAKKNRSFVTAAAGGRRKRNTTAHLHYLCAPPTYTYLPSPLYALKTGTKRATYLLLLHTMRQGKKTTDRAWQ